MHSSVLALRAIGAQFALRLYVPVIIGAAIIFALLFSCAWWLTTISSWWWLLFIPMIVIFCVAVAALWVTWLLIRFVRPQQTKAQKQAVKHFVNKLQGVAETIGTPKFILLFKVVRSIAAPSKRSFLSDVASNRELGKDFRAVQRSFDRPNVIE